MSKIAALAVMHLTCPTCGASPGRYCFTSSGKRATRTHTPRMRPLEAARWIGTRDMAKMTVSIVSYKLDPDKAHADIYADIEKVLEMLRRWT